MIKKISSWKFLEKIQMKNEEFWFKKINQKFFNSGQTTEDAKKL